MLKYFILSFAISSLFSLGKVQGQGSTEDNRDLKRGKIISQEDSTAIPFITILNLNSYSATYSDENGFFQIPAQEGDVIVFTAVQFENDTLTIGGNKPEENYLSIQLKPATYLLEEVNIYGLPDEPRFKRNVLAYQPPVIEQRQAVNMPAFTEAVKKDPVTEEPRISLLKPGQFINNAYLKFSKTEREKRAFARAKQNTPKQNLKDSKFNKLVVQEITSFEGSQLDRFMIYCRQQFSEDYLLWVNEYDLIVAVNQNAKEFLSSSDE